MRTYVVKTGDGYLYPMQGSISFTDDLEHAGHFLAADEAHVIAQLFGYTEERYRVIAIDLPERG
ncbi:hypothetical protein [Noviherbaspirillum sedimenti]|nr:hypothetical protein [Noviherbaspirillum sedimenti]